MNNQTLLATVILALAAGLTLFLVLTVLDDGGEDVSSRTPGILRLEGGDYTELEFRELLRIDEPDFAAFWCEGTLGDLSGPSPADTFGLLSTSKDADRARTIIGEECQRVGR